MGCSGRPPVKQLPLLFLGTSKFIFKNAKLLITLCYPNFCFISRISDRDLKAKPARYSCNGRYRRFGLGERQ